MKHVVATLEGALLDAAVAKAEGQWSPDSIRAIAEHPGVWRPSLDWRFGGPIIERERITLHAPEGGDPWQAYLGADILGGEVCSARAYAGGATLLIAAMRAYVASKFGAEVELP